MGRYIVFDLLVALFVFTIGFLILYGSLQEGFTEVMADITGALKFFGK